MLTAEQYGALATASITRGVPTAYFAGDGGEELGWSGTYGHRLVSLDRYDEYICGWPLEHFLFAPTAAWGVVTGPGDEHAIVAGTDSFISDLRVALRYDEEATVRAFFDQWRATGQMGGSVEWVPALLQHVFGPDSNWISRWANG